MISVYYTIVNSLLQQYRELATNVDIFRVRPLLELFADVVREAGSILPEDVVAFIDARMVQTRRPQQAAAAKRAIHGDAQRSVYNG